MQAFLLFLALVAASCASPSTRTQSEHHSAAVPIEALISGEVNIGVVALKNKARYEQALAIKEQHLGPDHPDLVPYLAVLGSLLRREGDYPRAHALLERALRG